MKLNKKIACSYHYEQGFYNQGGYAWTEIILGCLLLMLISTSGIKGYQLLQQNKTVQLHYLLNQIHSAWYDFHDQYRALPGDYAFAQTNIDSGLRNGNGNGLIDNDWERGQVWAHLAAVGSLNGLPKNKFTGNAFKINQPCQSTLCPDNGYGRGIFISADNPNGNAIFTGKGISLTILTLLDQQIDDGLAKSGKIQLVSDAPASCFNNRHYANTDDTHCEAMLPLPSSS